MTKSNSFTQGPIFSPLIKFAFPVLAALFLQALYGAVDLLVVGQFGGDKSEIYVSAVSTGSQLMHTVTIVITSLAMGLTVFIGRKIGAGQNEEAGRIIGSGICFFAIVGAIVTVVMVFASSAMASIMQAPKEAFDDTVKYIMICSAGAVFIVAYNLVGSIFRGLGDSKLPLITVAIACVLNIVGDLILVAVFDMGAVGAAIATVVAQAVSVVLSLAIIKRRQLPFCFSVKHIAINKAYVKEIIKIGTPIALQELLVGISFLAILAIVNDIGLTESAGIGVAEKLCGFIMLIPSSFMQSMSAFVAQNIGAQKPDRAQKALWCGIAMSLSAGIVIGCFSFLRGDILAGIFAKDTPVIMAAWDYLKAYAIDCLLTAFLFCFIGYFNGCSATGFVMVQGMVGAFCVRLPLCWLISRHSSSLFHIGLATPSSTIVQIILCFAYFFVLKKQLYKRG